MRRKSASNVSFTRAASFFPAAVLLAACASTAPEPDVAERNYAELIDALVEEVAESRARTQVPALPAGKATGGPLPDGVPGESPFDVDCTDTDARSFFRALVEYTPRNIIVHPEVAGQVSLNLRGVTVPEVLEIVSEVYGYAYRVGPSGYIVYPASTRTQIFQIDYLDLQRSGTSRTRVSSGQVSESNRNAMRGGNQMVGSFGAAPVAAMPGGMGMPGMAGMGNMGMGLEISGSNINTTYEADFWTELEETLQSMVGDDPGNQVVVNSQTGVILVRAMPNALRSVEEYLDTIQDVAARQVVLEAKIVEVTLNESYSAGINWIAVAENSDGDTFTFGQNTPSAGFGGDVDSLLGEPISVSPGNIVDSLQGTSQGGAFTMAFDIGDFNAFLELLEVHGDTRVLSSPRVSTLNNQKAVIKAGSDEFFVTNVASNTVTGASSTTSRDVELTPFFSGIALDVTPQISGAGEVTLHIHPTVSEVTDQQKSLTVSGETDVLPLAFSEIRESDSIVKASSGQIIVIGGLMRTSETEEKFGLPGLSRVPGMKHLFSSRRTVSRKTELVILLKPIVVDDDRTWKDMAMGSIEHLRSVSQ
jgi:MSHA biogenesis protein MshL